MLICNILPNQVDVGTVREAYFKWYDLTFDYSLFSVFEDRVNALNHLRPNDYDVRSILGILVNFKQSNPINTRWEVACFNSRSEINKKLDM